MMKKTMGSAGALIALLGLAFGSSGGSTNDDYQDLNSAPLEEEAARSGASSIPQEETEIEPVVYDIGRFHVNLAGGDGQRVLGLAVSVEMEESKPAGASEQADGEPSLDPQLKEKLRNEVIVVGSGFTYAELEGLDGKMRLRDTMLTRMKALVTDKKITRLFFTEFVVQ